MFLLLAVALAGDPLPIDRDWDVLKAPGSSDASLRAAVADAGQRLGDWKLEFCGIDIDGPYLTALAAEAPDDPFLRVVRERTGRAIDLPDFLRFLDDVLAAEDRRGQQVFVTAGRARGEGVLVHPDDVFKNKPRTYARKPTLPVDEPLPQEELLPAPNGALLGPNWTTRFKNPASEEAMLNALAEEAPAFAERVTTLVDQLKAQGAEVYVTSTVRYRERGYLMWGAFTLSQAKSEAQLEARLKQVEANNAAWELNVPIVWRHPDGWEATREAARAMADTYDVVYATERGAQFSNHYGGESADFVAMALPRTLTLKAPDGAEQTWDLSDPGQPRDLSLTPAVIDWIEDHFQMGKLRSDYPHWNDAAD